MTETRFAEPRVISESHDLSLFDCGEPALDDWLRERALENLRLGASRTYVSCEAGSKRVVGFYALSMGGILGSETTGAMRRNMPRVIPAAILGRLAVNRAMQGAGLGGALLRDATFRVLRAASEVSARLLLVHALSPAAESFYARYGFTRLPGEAPTLALDLVKLTKSAV